MRMAAQYELLKELLNSGTKLSFGQEFFFKFYQAFILKDRWTQYINGVSTTLLVTAIALALGIVLGSLPLYALGLGVALRLGRNAAIGAGAAGVLLAFFSVGGLAHGLMTGQLTGALATPLSWVPLAWPARLGSLGVEAFIDAARAAGPLLTTALAGLVLTLAADAVLLAWFCRFEDGRADA